MAKSVYVTAQFWLATAERAVKTAAQTAVALLATEATGLTDVEWTQTGSIVGLAAVLSVLTSLASVHVGENNGPSVAGEALAEPVNDAGGDE